MLAQLHGVDAGSGMHVVRNRDDHRVDILVLFFEHDAIIAVARRIRMRVKGDRCTRIIHVAKSHNILGLGTVPDVIRSLAARADGGNIQLLVGRLIAEAAQRRHTPESAKRHSACQQRAVEEVASGDTVAFHRLIPCLYEIVYLTRRRKTDRLRSGVSQQTLRAQIQPAF